MSNLTDSQQRALNQLRELTNGGSDDVSIGVLESTDWDVEVCRAGGLGVFCVLIYSPRSGQLN